ncbi:hypothetical protein KKF84_21410, partial [Myxococcota bacterium]|nr:hypothetical protein [Myxococcota bacterium]
SRALVLRLLGELPMNDERKKLQKAMINEVTASLRVKANMAYVEESFAPGYYSYMDSSGRSTAMVLMALLRVAPEHPLVTRMVNWFLRGRPRGQFRNTQEAGWGLLAMMEYAKVKEKALPDYTAGVWLGRNLLMKQVFRGRTTKPTLFTFPMSKLHRTLTGGVTSLTFAKKGTGILYYNARLRYSPTKIPTESKSQGFTVSKTITLLSAGGKPLPKATRLSAGDTVLVTVSVKTLAKRDFVVIDDPLPAGMESIDTSYINSSATMNTQNLLKSDRYDHRELRDDRVVWFMDTLPGGSYTYRYLARVNTSGTFTAPPVHAEEMYNPERYGHGVGRTLTFH